MAVAGAASEGSAAPSGAPPGGRAASGACGAALAARASAHASAEHACATASSARARLARASADWKSCRRSRSVSSSCTAGWPQRTACCEIVHRPLSTGQQPLSRGARLSVYPGPSAGCSRASAARSAASRSGAAASMAPRPVSQSDSSLTPGSWLRRPCTSTSRQAHGVHRPRHARSASFQGLPSSSSRSR